MAPRRTPSARPPAPRAGARPAPRGSSRPSASATARPSAAKARPTAKARTTSTAKARPTATTKARPKAATKARPSATKARPAAGSKARGGSRGPAGRSERSRRAALGQVDGTSDARRAKGRRRRRLVGSLVATVLLVGVLFIAVFPTRSYLAQRAATARSEAELREVQEEQARIRAETARLEDDAEIAKEARENGMVGPGEEPYRVLPEGVDPIGLPEGWPFTGVERALGAS